MTPPSTGSSAPGDERRVVGQRGTRWPPRPPRAGPSAAAARALRIASYSSVPAARSASSCRCRSIGPGHTPLTRMPSGPSSIAAARTKFTHAALRRVVRPHVGVGEQPRHRARHGRSRPSAARSAGSAACDPEHHAAHVHGVHPVELRDRAVGRSCPAPPTPRCSTSRVEACRSGHEHGVDHARGSRPRRRRRPRTRRSRRALSDSRARRRHGRPRPPCTAVGREPQGRGGPDPRRRAGDDRDLRLAHGAHSPRCSRRAWGQRTPGGHLCATAVRRYSPGHGSAPGTPIATSPWTSLGSPRPPRSPPAGGSAAATRTRRRRRGRRHAPRPQHGPDGRRRRHRRGREGRSADALQRRGDRRRRRRRATSPSTRSTAPPSPRSGRNDAIAVIAVAERGTMFDPGPCVYMEKIAVGPEAADVIDLDASVTANLEAVAKAKGEEVSDVTAVVLDRDRHADIIRECREAGARVTLIPDGDVAARSRPRGPTAAPTSCSGYQPPYRTFTD